MGYKRIIRKIAKFILASQPDAFVQVTIFYKGIMPSEKILDLPVDCNTLTGSVNLGYENINHLALIVKAHGLPIIQIARNAVNL